MPQQAPATDPLRVFLSGKRRFTRIAVDLQVALTYAGTRLRGRVLDLSQGGALVCVTAEEMRRVGGGPEEVLSSLVREFSSGFDVRFIEKGTRARAEMVRLSLPTAPDEDEFFLGCRFRRPLSNRQAQRLGLDA